MWQRFRNELNWQLKQRFTLSRRARVDVRHKPQRARIYTAAHQHRRLRELLLRYDCAAFNRCTTRRAVKENVYVLDILDRYLGGLKWRDKALDVGSKNWSYFPALYSFYPRPWLGVEIDGHQRYWDMTTRKSRAAALCAPFAGCQYRVASILQVQGQYDLLTWFLPLLDREVHRAWGLPLRFFQPEKMLAHTLSLMSPQGTLFIVNQGEREARWQAQLLAGHGVAVHDLGCLTSPFVHFRQPRFGWRITAR